MQAKRKVDRTKIERGALWDAHCLLCEAHRELNYLLTYEILAEVVDHLGTAMLRKYQHDGEGYEKEIERTKRALEKLTECMRAANNSEKERELARRFNQVVTSTIAAYGLTPAHAQLYKLIDALRGSTFHFAANIIESAIGNSEHVTPSAYILSGLTCLGLYKPESLPTPSQIQELDRAYHGRK